MKPQRKTLRALLRLTKIGFEFETARPHGLVALINARIITMKGDEVIDKGTILIKDNRIEAIGAKIDIPANARRIDMEARAGRQNADGSDSLRHALRRAVSRPR